MAKRRPEVTRDLLLRAGFAVLDSYYTSAAERPSLPVAISDVLLAVPEVARPDEPHALTTGAVGTTFGGKIGYLKALSAAYTNSDKLIGDLAVAVEEISQSAEDPATIRRRLAEADFTNMTRSEAPTRHWFLTHAYAASPDMAKELKAVYQAFDNLLGDLYTALGQREKVRPVAGLRWSDVAMTLTAWLEGQALRYLSDLDARDRPWLTDPTSGTPV